MFRPDLPGRGWVLDPASPRREASLFNSAGNPRVFRPFFYLHIPKPRHRLKIRHRSDHASPSHCALHDGERAGYDAHLKYRGSQLWRSTASTAQAPIRPRPHPHRRARPVAVLPTLHQPRRRHSRPPRRACRSGTCRRSRPCGWNRYSRCSIVVISSIFRPEAGEAGPVHADRRVTRGIWSNPRCVDI